MGFIHVYCQWIFIFTFTVGLNPPQNVQIIIKDSNAALSWTLPPEPVKKTYLYVFKGTSTEMVLNTSVKAPGTSYTTTVLSPCEQYTVGLKSKYKTVWSDYVNITFWMTAGLSPPQNVNITVKGKNVTFTWTLPSESVTSTYLDVFNGNGTNKAKVISENITSPRSSYTSLKGLLPCQQYTTKLQIGNDCNRSEVVEKTFWTTDNVFTSDINTDVNLTWTTVSDAFYTVMSPSITIYTVTGGYIGHNSVNDTHFQIDSNDLHQIRISVLNVTQSDSGLYKTVALDQTTVDGCCLLIITDKPTKPKLTYDKHPFVGFQTQLTCKSEVRRWPLDPASSLSYTFPDTGEQHNNILTINVTKSDKGKTVDCQATDDKRKQSDFSNVITVDPYYGPDNSTISSPGSHVDVMEGDNLEPIVCSADCNPNCTYVWTFNRTIVNIDTILKINNIGRSKGGIYTCYVTHPNSTIRPTHPSGGPRNTNIDVTVNVLSNPTKPQLTYDKHPFVGFQTVFTCKSKVQRWPSDPASNLSYSFPDIGEQHYNILTINVTKSDKGKTVDCNATDDKNQQSNSSDVITLDPYYGPDNGTISSSGSHVDVMEGDNLYPIICSADCNPNCTYVWIFNRTIVNNGTILKINNVSRSNGGIYSCNVTHPNSTIRPTHLNGGTRNTKIDVTVNVLSKPTKPQLTYDRHPFVGFQTVFTCKSKVRRWPCDPASNLSYSFPTIGEQHNNILIINVTKSDNGKTVDCNATDDKNKQSDSSDVINLDPYYGPSSVSISPPTSHVNVTEGDELNPIHCSADCNPNCTYVWKHNTTKIIDGQILKIDKVTRMVSGIYRCRVTHPNSTIRPTYPNGGKRKTKIDVTVNVVYPPSFKSLQFRKGTSSFQNYSTMYEFNEGDHVFLKMNIESKPKSHLYFYPQSNARRDLKYNISSSYYTAGLSSLKCEDAGLYTIEANNGIKNSTIRTVELIIQCEPKHITPDRQIIGTKIGALENVTINVVAYPEPEVQWLNDTGCPWKKEQRGTNYSYKLSSAVQIEDESRFGQYGVKIYNKAGSTSIYITLVPKDKPQPPYNVSIVDLFPNKANLTWIAGFDGGDEQSFSIKYKKSNEQSFKTIDLNATRIKKDTALSYMLTGLEPSTSYNIYVIAKNSFGAKNKSKEFITNAAPIPVEKSGGSIIVIICSSTGGLVIIIACLGIICYKRRRDQNRTGITDSKVEYAAVNKTNERRQIGATATQENTAGTRNDVYASVDKTNVKKTHHKAAQENTAGTRNDVYASVDKTNVKKTHNKGNTVEMVETEYADVGESSRNVEIDENDIYENQGKSQMADAEKTGRIQNDDGLTYIEVTFSKNTSDHKPIIHGIEDRTIYMDIDFTRRAEPLQEEESD